jgi:hypothetical protein
LCLRNSILKFDAKPYYLDIRLRIFYPNLGFPQPLVYQGLINTYSLLSPRTPNVKPLYILLYLYGVCKCILLFYANVTQLCKNAKNKFAQFLTQINILRKYANVQHKKRLPIIIGSLPLLLFLHSILFLKDAYILE